MVMVLAFVAFILSSVEAEVEDCPGFGKPCPPNQKCCMDGTACCTFIHLRPDIRNLTSEKFAIWNLWFFWFLTIFILMICTGACAYWRSQYRNRFFGTRSFVWSALDPYTFSSNFPNFSTATTLEPRTMRRFTSISWRRQRNEMLNRNPVFSTLGFVCGNDRITLQPPHQDLPPAGRNGGAHNVVTHGSSAVTNEGTICPLRFISLPPSYAEATTSVNDLDKCLCPPPYDKQPQAQPSPSVVSSGDRPIENAPLECPPPYHEYPPVSQ